MQLPIHHHKTRDIHEQICLNMDRYKINRDESVVDLDRIKFVVKSYFKLIEEEFVSDNRLYVLVSARSFYCGLAKSLTRFSLKVIGQGIGGRDHSTVLHNIQRLTNIFFSEPKLKEVYENMKADILDKPIPYPNNYKYEPRKNEKLTSRQIRLLKEKAFEIDEIEIIHSQNNKGYSHNHEKLYE